MRAAYPLIEPADRVRQAIASQVPDRELAGAIWTAYASQHPHSVLWAPEVAAPPAAPQPSVASRALAHELHCLAAIGGRGGAAWARAHLDADALLWARRLGGWPRIWMLARRGPRALAAALAACAPPKASGHLPTAAKPLQTRALWAAFCTLAELPRETPAPTTGGRSLGAWYLAAVHALATRGPGGLGRAMAAGLRACPLASAYL